MVLGPSWPLDTLSRNVHCLKSNYGTIYDFAEDVAKGRGRCASQYANSLGYTADLALDGNTDYDSGHCAYPSNPGGNAWWMVDLGSEFAVHNVTIHSSQSSKFNTLLCIHVIYVNILSMLFWCNMFHS